MGKDYRAYLEVSYKGVPLWGSHIEDCNIFGSVLESPCFGKVPQAHQHHFEVYLRYPIL